MSLYYFRCVLFPDVELLNRPPLGGISQLVSERKVERYLKRYKQDHMTNRGKGIKCIHAHAVLERMLSMIELKLEL